MPKDRTISKWEIYKKMHFQILFINNLNLRVENISHRELGYYFVSENVLENYNIQDAKSQLLVN